MELVSGFSCNMQSFFSVSLELKVNAHPKHSSEPPPVRPSLLQTHPTTHLTALTHPAPNTMHTHRRRLCLSHILPSTNKPSRYFGLCHRTDLRSVQYTIHPLHRISLLAMFQLSHLSDPTPENLISKKRLAPQKSSTRNVMHSRAPTHRDQSPYNDK